MNISLFSQTLVLIIFGLIVGATVYLSSKIDQKYRICVIVLMVLLGIGVSVLLEYITGQITQSANELPGQYWLMIFPFAFDLFILPGILFTRLYIKKHQPTPKRGRKKIVEAAKPKTIYLTLIYIFDIVLSAAFLLVLANSYYHYYPTLATVFGVGQSRTVVLSQENKITLQFSANGIGSNNNSIEASIYNNNPTTNRGQSYNFNIPGTISKFATRGGWLYVPSIAFNSTNLVKLPVLVMLPGSPGVVSNVVSGSGLENALQQLAADNHGITPLVYVADDNGASFNDTECVNSPKGNVETYLTVDVPNYIKSHFNVSDNPSNWAIGGISMGGTCAIMLTLANPSVYHYFVDIGGEIGPTFNSGDSATTTKVLFNGSTDAYNLHQPLYLLAHNKYTGIGGFFGNGLSDTPDVTTAISQLYDITKQQGFDVVHETVNGGHTFDIFTELVKQSLPWVSNRIGATSCTESIVCQ
jgi:S-formylglutathione hydrolase FrmB